MNRISPKEVAAAIRKYNRFLISAHTSPEGDALGSELALFHLLKKLGKQAIIINEDPLPQEYNFLPEKDNIRLYRPDFKDIAKNAVFCHLISSYTRPDMNRNKYFCSK